MFHLIAEMLMSYKTQYLSTLEIMSIQNSDRNNSPHDFLITHCVSIIDILDTLLERYKKILLLVLFIF